MVLRIFKSMNTKMDKYGQSEDNWIKQRDLELSLKNMDKYEMEKYDEADFRNDNVIDYIAKRNNVNKDQLRLGIQVEREHTNSQKDACTIALDHLTEEGNSDNYYTQLMINENEAKHDEEQETNKALSGDAIGHGKELVPQYQQYKRTKTKY